MQKNDFDMLNYKKKVSFGRLEQEVTKISETIAGLKLPAGFLTSILYIISEVSANVKEHSHAKNVSLTITIGKKNAEINIADDGIGFRTSYLRKKIYPKDDFSAIEFALSGLSTKGSQERGFGLYSIKKLTEALKGQLIIKTGKEVKEIAQKTAKELGLPLSTLINAYLKQFIATKEAHFSVLPKMSPKLEKLIVQVRKDAKKGKNLSPVSRGRIFYRN